MLGQANFWTLVIGTALLPLIVFLFSTIVTRTFNMRCTIAAVIGASGIVAAILNRSKAFQRAVPIMIVFLSLLTFAIHRPGLRRPFSAGAIKYLSDPYPIVIADGLQFFPLEESASAEIRSRLVYLTLPPEVPASDPINQHAIERWKVINPNVPVDDLDDFLKSHSRFYVLDQQSSDDTPASYLLSKHLIVLVARYDGSLIYRSCSPSQSDIR